MVNMLRRLLLVTTRRVECTLLTGLPSSPSCVCVYTMRGGEDARCCQATIGEYGELEHFRLTEFQQDVLSPERCIEYEREVLLSELIVVYDVCLLVVYG